MEKTTWKYVLVYSDDFMTYDEAKNFLNVLDEVVEWLHVFENTFILRAGVSGRYLGNLLLRYVKKNTGIENPIGYFFITEISEDKQGWIPLAAWEIINGMQAPKSITGSNDYAEGDGDTPL